MSSCCKVKIEDNKNEITGKSSYFVNFLKNIISIFFSVIVLTVLMPIIWGFGIWVIFDSYVFKREHTFKRLIDLVKKGVMGAFRYDDDLEVEDTDSLDDLIKHPENYDIIGLDKEKKGTNGKVPS